MREYQHLINSRAVEKASRWISASESERSRIVHLDEWAFYERGITDPRTLSRPELRKLYLDYQNSMIEMHFLEWDSATYWNLNPNYNLFGR